MRRDHSSTLRYRIVALTARMTDAATKLRALAAELGMDRAEADALFAAALTAETEAAVDLALERLQTRMLAIVNAQTSRARKTG